MVAQPGSTPGAGRMGTNTQSGDGSTDTTIDPAERPLVEEVRTAYSDAGPQRDDDAYNTADRCLTFLASGWFEDGVALAAAFRAIRDYNRFDAERVITKMRAASDESDFMRVAVGREGSPVVYVETSNPHALRQQFGEYTDEYMDATPTGFGQARKWDDDDGYDTHSMCRHDEPVTTVDEYPEGTGEHEVIRMWWD